MDQQEKGGGKEPISQLSTHVYLASNENYCKLQVKNLREKKNP